jgi:hypothetical protein
MMALTHHHFENNSPGFMNYQNKVARHLSKYISCVGVLCSTVHAATYQLETIFSDVAEAPAGNGPWLTFSSTKMKEVVKVEFQANLTGSEFVSEWYINLDPALEPRNLVFSNPIKTGDFDLPTLAIALDANKADGDGFYDIKLIFSTKSRDRFDASEKLSYEVSYLGGELEQTSFSFLSEPGGGSGPFVMAAHIEGTLGKSQGSAWVSAVPEPSTAIYTLVATGICLSIRRRRPVVELRG